MNNSATSDPVSKIFRYFKSEKIHPAILICGKNQEERLSLAKKLAKVLLCHSDTSSPCEKCRTCSRIEREIHPDVFIVRETEENIIKISVIREIIEQIELGPIEEKYKLCIIENCERMNDAAANAFLKTLEEPLNNRLFLLLTSKPHFLLPTILSRCLEFNLKPDESTSSFDLESSYLTTMNKLNVDETIDNLHEILLDEKTCNTFILFIQSKLRESMIKHYNNDYIFDNIISCFEDAIQTEKIISTNANQVLAIESFLRKHFLDSDLWQKIS